MEENKKDPIAAAVAAAWAKLTGAERDEVAAAGTHGYVNWLQGLKKAGVIAPPKGWSSSIHYARTLELRAYVEKGEQIPPRFDPRGSKSAQSWVSTDAVVASMMKPALRPGHAKVSGPKRYLAYKEAGVAVPKGFAAWEPTAQAEAEAETVVTETETVTKTVTKTTTRKASAPAAAPELELDEFGLPVL